MKKFKWFSQSTLVLSAIFAQGTRAEDSFDALVQKYRKPQPVVSVDESPKEHKEVKAKKAKRSKRSMGEAWVVREPARVKSTPVEVKAPVVVPAPASVEAKEDSQPAPSSQLSGFLDVQYRWIKDASNTYGIYLHDGALQWTHKAHETQFFLDLPFGADQSDPSKNTIVFGRDKAQAYLKHSLSDELAVQVGQFDTIFGYELNDSRDVFFTSQGLVFAGLLPVTHTGFLATFTAGKFTAKGMVANPSNAGMMNQKNPEAGAQLSYALTDTEALNFGVLYGKQDEVTTILYDFVAGASVGLWRTDVEFDAKSVTDADLAWGMLWHNVFTLNPTWFAGVRLEYLSKVSNFKDMGLTVGPSVKVNDNLKVRADYSLVRATPVEGASVVKTHKAALSAVYSF